MMSSPLPGDGDVDHVPPRTSAACGAHVGFAPSPTHERSLTMPLHTHARRTLALTLAAAALLGACGSEATAPAPSSAPAAPTAPAAPAPAAPAAPAPATGTETLQADLATSSIGFTGSKITGSHDGTFARFTGTVELVDGAPERSKVSVDIEMDSLVIEPERLRTHLLSADLFDAPQFPRAKFVSRTIAPATTPGATHVVSGDLTLHGVTKPLSFPATIRVTPEAVEADAQLTINRREFGIVYPGMPDDLIRDEVPLRLQLRAPRRR
jgi:polyisoprenoid-binding protein YceI